MIKSIVYFLIIICLDLGYTEDYIDYSYDQLPLSSDILKTFPKLKCPCFIVCSIGSRVVLHHKNSQKKIHIGSLRKYIINHLKNDNLEILNNNIKKYGAKETMISSIKKEDDDKYSDDKTTLYDISCLFKFLLDSEKNNNIFMESEISGKGCVLKYLNKNNCEFMIVLYGYNTFEEIKGDIDLLKIWLDQFIEYTIFEGGDHIANVPILYAKSQNKIELRFDHKIKLIMTYGKTHNVRKKIVYKTITKAPKKKDSVLGKIFLYTKIFKNPITINLKTNHEIEAGNRIKMILDSISYILLGTPFNYKR